MSNLFRLFFGSRQDRWLKQARRRVAQINAIEPIMSVLPDDELTRRTQTLRERLAAGQSMDALLPEAFAVVREAARRTLGLRAFDVQILGGLALHEGKIAEMRTGEGKTLSAAFPAYLNALPGAGVHVVTVNDYLARRDAATMAPMFALLGMTVGVVFQDQPKNEKRHAYACDITYGTNNEFGFDYLRDNLATDSTERVQRRLAFAIIDEVDSILIDEARTPLIISGPQDNELDLYHAIDKLSVRLSPQAVEDGPGDFYLDAKTRSITLSEDGQSKADDLLSAAGLLLPNSLYDQRHLSLLQHLNAALRARHAYRRDKDYIVRDGQVVIVDEFTGRALAGRRWGEGLHQAIEAKEGVEVRPEDHVLATITLQNFFRGYDRLSGMTGTADTEAYELQEIYGLEVMVIPTHRPMIREDREDMVFLTSQAKFDAVVADITDCHARLQPVLVGTTSIEVSEMLATRLAGAGIAHEVLNAKQHEREAGIIANAGLPGAVTIATNMAGRGTDIVLGGLMPPPDDPDFHAWQRRHEQVVAVGGLHVIGTERHESRRIDNQLRGRSGRQGDPGSSRFYLSLDDHLLKVFMPSWSRAALERAGMRADQPIAARLVSRQVEAAQRKIEGFYFDQRKQLLEYDDVANRQRQTVYEHRQRLLELPDPQAELEDLATTWARQLVEHHGRDTGSLLTELTTHGVSLSVWPQWQDQEPFDAKQASTWVATRLHEQLSACRDRWGDRASDIFRAALLVALDKAWQEQLAALSALRSGIHLRAMAQKQPKQEYRLEGFALFEQMSQSLPGRTLPLVFNHHPAQEELATPSRPLSRNAPCHCGSGLRYKHCHGRLQPLGEAA